MEATPFGETLAALCRRHLRWIEQPLPEAPHFFQKTRLLNQLTSFQIDLMQFHSDDAQALQLLRALDTLAGQDLVASEFQAQLLATLHAAK